MRRDILLGVVLLAAPIIAIAQSAPTPPDEPASNTQWGNEAEPANAAEEAMGDNATDRADKETPLEPEAPQT